jgi:malate dehydrogenase
MSLVAIVGAGETGAAAARALAGRTRVDRITLIDDSRSVASGKALDLLQAGPVRGSDTVVESGADLTSALGAAAIILADPVESDKRSDEGELGLLRGLQRAGALEGSVVICAGAHHRMLMQRGFAELRLSRRRLIGSAPEALAAAAKTLVALEARAASHQVTLYVLGNPPEKMVVPWSDTSIAGHAAASVLTAAQLHRIERQMRGLWPPGPGTLGTAAAVIAEAVVRGSRTLFSAFVSLDRDNGTAAPVCAWPVAVGPAGIERTTTPALSGRDRVVVDEVLG